MLQTPAMCLSLQYLKSPIVIYTVKCLIGLSIGYWLFVSFPNHQFFWYSATEFIHRALHAEHGDVALRVRLALVAVVMTAQQPTRTHLGPPQRDVLLHRLVMMLRVKIGEIQRAILDLMRGFLGDPLHYSRRDAAAALAPVGRTRILESQRLGPLEQPRVRRDGIVGQLDSAVTGARLVDQRR